jgi:CRP-like cAMP-binding protein
MADRKVEQLRRMPIFSRCSKAQLESLARNTDEVDLAAGRTLIVQGQANHTFYLLLKGEVEVEVQGHPPRRLGQGDFVGEISMIDPGPATATVVTTTPVEALVMSHAQFHNAIKADETIALRVMAVMAERLRRSGLTEGSG